MDEAYFWTQLEAEYGTINLHIRNILKKQNLCSQSLAKLNAATIRGIEMDMQLMAGSLREEAAAGGTPLSEIYGGTYANEPENFKFMNGEVLCLLDLAEVMKIKGIKHFIKRKRSSAATAVSTELDEADAAEQSRRLCDKVMLHFTSQGIEDSSYDEFLEKLKYFKVTIFTDGAGTFRAEALCPICQADGKSSKLSFSMDKRQNWHIYSFTRHSNTMHYQIPENSQQTYYIDNSDAHEGRSDVQLEHHSDENNEQPSEQLNFDESNKDSTPLLEVQIGINKRFQLQRNYGTRYSEFELDTAAYLFLTSGMSAYKFKRANMHLPSLKSVQRHIATHTNETQEGVLMINPLLKYLDANNFPRVVALSEDGTAISPNPEYSPRTDSVRGLVAPYNSQGMPILDFFKARSAEKMIVDLEKNPVGEYVYIVMATPMVAGASPICILYMCSDNKFTHEQVKRRWKHIEDTLKDAGVDVIAHASDGDPRLLRAMKERTSLPHPDASRLYGHHFIANMSNNAVCIQDTVHLVNKLRHSLLNPRKQMLLGDHVVSSDSIRQMIERGDKVIHKMNPSDLNPADKMKFDPTLKLMSPALVDHLREVVPDSKGTAVYLQIMRMIYISFIEDQISPMERICTIWTALFFLRAWRWQCLESSKSIKQCITSNVYWCLELNAHGLVNFMVNCRKNNSHDQFIVQNLSSQPCETTFRELRSMTTVNHTAVNFTMKDVEQRMQRVQMKLLIAHRRKNILAFPSLRKQASKALAAKSCELPDDDQIKQAIEKAAQDASELLISVGFDPESINFTNSMILRKSNITPEAEVGDTNNNIQGERNQNS
ncbi:uncharacterized protein LOC131686793 [Topomyia yanbarensis]|uniref:uncharacterized protein LOC131686793 n=1 Tax=Topomyia yanbarensis TaxID=2498891 RepID=UPI00273B5E64|nr:uncharacterized protein LOC131686793 [Topomyia yanbarensis]